ncbi:MAG: DNA-3-methyladenine glycosylase 2 family protein [Candidatus Odinarchaeota archaeon]|nr:DNA-3-methyladenine glycosylase 2 family protein [Candidatus Odinarchaeota archaeon]
MTDNVNEIVLKNQYCEYLYPKPPFHFDGTAHVPMFFPTPDFLWKPGVLWQAINFNDLLIGIKMVNEGEVNDPEIELLIFSAEPLSSSIINLIKKDIEWRFGLNEDISEFCNRFRDDDFLREPIKMLGGMRMLCSNSLYEILVISILLQNCTIKRTVQMINNLFSAFGKKLIFDVQELYAFWSPSAIVDAGEQKLRELKLGYRAKILWRISYDFYNHNIDEMKIRSMSMEDAQKEIIKLYGIGPASAQIILGEYLRRYEYFTLKGRFWEQKILSRIMFNKPLVEREIIEAELEKRYGKWKYLAVFYMFQYLFWKHEKEPIDWLKKR